MYVEWRFGGAVEDSVEGYVSAESMGQKEAGHYAFVNYV
jgi:hypothetical protein